MLSTSINKLCVGHSTQKHLCRERNLNFARPNFKYISEVGHLKSNRHSQNWKGKWKPEYNAHSLTQSPTHWGRFKEILLIYFEESISLSGIGFRDKSKENGEDGTYFHGIFPITDTVPPPPPLLVNTPRPIFSFSRISPNVFPPPDRWALWAVPTGHTHMAWKRALLDKDGNWISKIEIEWLITLLFSAVRSNPIFASTFSFFCSSFYDPGCHLIRCISYELYSSSLSSVV